MLRFSVEMKLAILMLAALLAAAPPARAQSDASVALGLSFAVTNPADASAETASRPRLLLRLRTPPGLGSTIGFNWFSSAVRTTIGGQETDLGRIGVRPVMVGPAYTVEHGRVTAVFSLQAGYAFTNIRDTGSAKREYQKLLGPGPVGIKAENAFAWCPNASLWLDLSSRYGLMVSVGYLGVRPTIATTSSLGTVKKTVDLGSIVTSVGIAYAIF